MGFRLRHSPAYALAIAALLAAGQASAFLAQWRQGFRPFGAAPGRVPFSWDMFAVEIERCGVSWEPPSYWEGRALARLSDLAAPFEWDTVFNRRNDYIYGARLACAYRDPHDAVPDGRFRVRCFSSGAKETQDEFACPSGP